MKTKLIESREIDVVCDCSTYSAKFYHSLGKKEIREKDQHKVVALVAKLDTLNHHPCFLRQYQAGPK